MLPAIPARCFCGLPSGWLPLVTLLVLLFLIAYILIRGIPHLKPSLFAWEYTSDNVSLTPALVNTVTMTLLTLLFALPVGIGSAIYLAEYAKRGSRLVDWIRLTAETLSGIPSIVYGLFGYLLFNVTLHWGYSLLGGALTLAIMILPLIMRTTEEALQRRPGRLPRGLLRSRRGTAADGIPRGAAERRAGYSLRRHPRHRAHRRRDRRSDLHRRYRHRRTRIGHGFGPHPLRAYVRSARRGLLHE